ncbi:MAG: hypothetical protein M3Z23_11235 [Acidobacteriota bacterium]|nr:hypothetical protein [Acidobacteriota bacterium]
MFGLLEIWEKEPLSKKVTIAASSGFEFNFGESVKEVDPKIQYVSEKDLRGMSGFHSADGKPIALKASKSPAGIFNYGPDYPLKKGEKKVDDKKSNDIKCAAPKLIQFYNHFVRKEMKQPILYMSEVYCSPGQEKPEDEFAHGHTAASCNVCRINIPKMLWRARKPR